MVRFLHTADWQLGMTRHFLKGEAQARFNDARLNAIDQIGNIAINEGCQFVVVCGDVFESNQIERQVLTRALERMGAFPKVTFYLLPGNHDPLDAASIYRSPTFTKHRPDNVVVLDGSGRVQPVPGVELIAAPWRNKHPVADLVGEACQELEPTDAVRIVVGHGPNDAELYGRDANAPEIIRIAQLEERIRVGMIQFVALGDRHSKTRVGATDRVWYAGAPEPTDYDEVDPGHVLLVDVDADDVQVVARTVGTWKFVSEERDLRGEEEIDALEEWLSGLTKKERAIVKLTLIGHVSLAQKTRLDGILVHYGELLGALETWERRSELVVLPDELDYGRLELSGFMRDAVEELSEQAQGGEDALKARGALALLYRLKETQE